MNLPVPQASVDAGPAWAQNTQSSLTIIDSHNHSPGSGVPINPAGININSALTMAQNDLIQTRTVRFYIPSGLIASTSPDVGCIFASPSGELIYNDTTGHQVQITNNGSVAGVAGSITNLTAPASVVFTSGGTSGVYKFNQAVGVAGNLDSGAHIIRYPGSAPTWTGNGVAIQANAALATQYTLTLPASLPVATSFLQVDPTGNVISQVALDNITLNQTAGNKIQIAPGGVNSAQIATSGVSTGNIAPLAVTTAKIADQSITLPKVINRTIIASVSSGPYINSGGAGWIVAYTGAANVAVNFTSTGGKMIWVGLVPDGDTTISGVIGTTRGAASASSGFRITRYDPTGPSLLTIGQVDVTTNLVGVTNSTLFVPCGGLWMVDSYSTVAGTTYNYQLYTNNYNGGGQNTYATNVRLMVYELL